MNIRNIMLLAVFTAPVSLMAQESYTIKGKVGKLGSPAKAYLTYKIKEERFLDSATINNGQFVFKGSVSSPREAHIMVKHVDMPSNPIVRPKEDVIAFFIENRTIELVSQDSISKAVIKGSPINDDNAKITAYLKPYYAKFDELNKEYASYPEEKKQDQATIGSLEKRADSIQKVIIAAKMSYIKSNPGKFMSLMAFNSTLASDFNANEAEKNFNLLSPEIRKTELGEEVLAKILKVKKTQDGAVAPDFTQNDINGNPVKLSDFRDKYVLLDFWASWCGPCRRENPNIVKAYNEYKDKGFTVLGVSLDKPADREKWIAAIKQDGLSWTQVSDLKEWDNEAARLYDVNAIPMNFLIDPNGKIIAQYLRGDNLLQKLKEVLGEGK